MFSEASSNIMNIMDGLIIHILRVFGSGTRLTVYRALHNTEAFWGGQGVFGPAPIGTLAKNKCSNIFNFKFNFQSVLIKLKNAYV